MTSQSADPREPAQESASTRDRLMTAAFAVVARLGLEGATGKEIAREAGVAPGLLHYHFPTRDALLEAALRRALDQYLAASRKRREDTPRDRQIAALFLEGRTTIAADLDFFRVRLAFAARALSDPALAATLRILNAEAVEETARTFAAARGAGEVAARDRSLAAVLKASIDGLMLTALTDPGFPFDEAAAALERMVRLELVS